MEMEHVKQCLCTLHLIQLLAQHPLSLYHTSWGRSRASYDSRGGPLLVMTGRWVSVPCVHETVPCSLCLWGRPSRLTFLEEDLHLLCAQTLMPYISEVDLYLLCSPRQTYAWFSFTLKVLTPSSRLLLPRYTPISFPATSLWYTYMHSIP